jgi:RNA polymerase sigma factor (sigma-70 family)
MSNPGTKLKRIGAEVDGPEEFRVGVAFRVFNWSLDRAIKAKGWKRTEAAKACGVSLQTLNHWLAFKSYPREANALVVSLALGVSDEILFPEEIKKVKITKQSEPVSFGREEALAFGMLSQEVDPERVAIHGSLTDAIEEAMQGLREREKLVLKLRFGLEGDEALTLAGAGAVLGVTPERIRQIEHVALRKLRHPSRIDLLLDYSHEL